MAALTRRLMALAKHPRFEELQPVLPLLGTLQDPAYKDRFLGGIVRAGRIGLISGRHELEAQATADLERKLKLVQDGDFHAEFVDDYLHALLEAKDYLQDCNVVRRTEKRRTLDFAIDLGLAAVSTDIPIANTGDRETAVSVAEAVHVLAARYAAGILLAEKLPAMIQERPEMVRLRERVRGLDMQFQHEEGRAGFFTVAMRYVAGGLVHGIDEDVTNIIGRIAGRDKATAKKLNSVLSGIRERVEAIKTIADDNVLLSHLYAEFFCATTPKYRPKGRALLTPAERRVEKAITRVGEHLEQVRSRLDLRNGKKVDGLHRRASGFLGMGLPAKDPSYVIAYALYANLDGHTLTHPTTVGNYLSSRGFTKLGGTDFGEGFYFARSKRGVYFSGSGCIRTVGTIHMGDRPDVFDAKTRPVRYVVIAGNDPAMVDQQGEAFERLLRSHDVTAIRIGHDDLGSLTRQAGIRPAELAAFNSTGMGHLAGPYLDMMTEYARCHPGRMTIVANQ